MIIKTNQLALGFEGVKLALVRGSFMSLYVVLYLVRILQFHDRPSGFIDKCDVRRASRGRLGSHKTRNQVPFPLLSRGHTAVCGSSRNTYLLRWTLHLEYFNNKENLWNLLNPAGSFRSDILPNESSAMIAAIKRA